LRAIVYLFVQAKAANTHFDVTTTCGGGGSFRIGRLLVQLASHPAIKNKQNIRRSRALLPQACCIAKRTAQLIVGYLA
jgi:hypothetical protein